MGQTIGNYSTPKTVANGPQTPAFAAWLRPRATLWATAGVAALGFLVALELSARHYGLPGPITPQAREVMFAPIRVRCCTPVRR
ncbi:hypothetical protein SHIRM173S_04187 [Streptomyces hirsutus]